MQINIAYCATNDQLEYASISAASALMKANKDDHYVFYIISEYFTPELQKLFLNLDRIKKSTFIFFRIPEERLKHLKQCNAENIGMLYRICLPELVKREEKILYLDTDTIVHSDLGFLYKYDITNYYLAAVEDKDEPEMRKKVRLSRDQLYINSGVLLMNLKKFREEELSEKILTHVKNSKYKNDQHSINAVCKNKIIYLPLKYNVMMYPEELPNKPEIYKKHQEEFLDAKEYPVIHHMILKPWLGEYQYLTTSIEWMTVKITLEELDKLYTKGPNL